ncbi:MAG: M1 family metallopeptidase [Crocinitomicaceae bacterium]
MRKIVLILVVALSSLSAFSQAYWQQHVDYKMDINFDTKNHQYEGRQTLKYTNNSPDDLNHVYYHLYFNAFQPGSMMDVRSRTIKDPDARVGSRIQALKENEIGFQNIISLTMNGQPTEYKIVGTILEVKLPSAIKSGETAEFKMEFRAQVPIQIRRSGRNSKDGIDYSMTQWYPKMSEYDKEGWHANPYVGREFHGVWGDFDVTIHMNDNYTIGGTGTLQNPGNIGKGYASSDVTPEPTEDGKLHWHFKAKNVHDFAWAADPDYKHDIQTLSNGTKIHFFYQPKEEDDKWQKVQSLTVKTFEYVNKNFGEYVYSDYSIIEGGDGGMEYPMATLVTGRRDLKGLFGVITHESIHSWYQGMLATNESKYPWMDEGFTSYVEYLALDHVLNLNQKHPLAGIQGYYMQMATSGFAEPLTTHADHYKLNKVYSASVYGKGAIFLDQLDYVIGNEAFMRGMMRYYNEWKLKHPTPEDFKRIMEKESGIELDWYFEQFIGTINTVDYGIESVKKKNKTSIEVVLARKGDMPMPLDITVKLNDGTEKHYYVPLTIMRGEKTDSKFGEILTVSEDWPWTNPTFTVCLDVKMGDVKTVEIDASGRLADVDRSNNLFPKIDEK